jgi:hypothetical protein
VLCSIWENEMTAQKHTGTGAHLRIYTNDGLVASFNINMDAVELASEIFQDYVAVDNDEC